MVTLADIVGLHKDTQSHLPTTHGSESIFNILKRASHQREQIGGLFEGILPNHQMTPVIQIPSFNRITVGEQHGIFGFIGDDCGSKTGHNIRPILIVGYLAETFGFTLGTEHPARLIQPFQRAVFLRLDTINDSRGKTIDSWPQS